MSVRRRDRRPRDDGVPDRLQAVAGRLRPAVEGREALPDAGPERQERPRQAGVAVAEGPDAPRERQRLALTATARTEPGRWPRVGIPKRVARWPSARVSFPAGAERRSMPRRHAPDPRSLTIVPPAVRRPPSTFGRTVIRFVGSHSQEAP